VEIMIIEIILYVLMIAVVFFALKPKKLNDFFKKIHLKNIKTSKLIKSIGKYVILLCIASVLVAGFFHIIGLGEDASIVSEIIKERGFLDVFILIFFAGVAEEILFRGYLLPKTTIWISTFLFALSHLGYGSITEIAGAFVLGFILAKQFEETENLWTVILTHMLYNFIVLAAVFSV